MNAQHPPTALITGGSAGLGLALARRLDAAGWCVITDGRDASRLHAAHADTDVVVAPGDVADAKHRELLARLVADRGGLDALVLNASTLGPVPLRPLAQLAPTDLGDVIRTNAGAQAALMILLADQLRRRDGLVLAMSSDAAVEHYPTWGAYGASKAALDHLVATFGVETGIAAYAVDPGDMATAMHAAADPDADPADLRDPDAVAGELLQLVTAAHRPPPGRYRAADLAGDLAADPAAGVHR